MLVAIWLAPATIVLNIATAIWLISGLKHVPNPAVRKIIIGNIFAVMAIIGIEVYLAIIWTLTYIGIGQLAAKMYELSILYHVAVIQVLMIISGVNMMCGVKRF